MTITDIEEKKAEERKREKRLVHFANALTREFTESLKSKSKESKTFAEYLTKSLLNYLFFLQHKEIGELNEEHIRHFLFEYAPQKLVINSDTGKEVPEILNKLVDFLDTEGYIKNGIQLKKTISENIKGFNKLLPTQKSPARLPIKAPKGKPPVSGQVKIGRNDPCPCGSGKKYKKCCGKKD